MNKIITADDLDMFIRGNELQFHSDAGHGWLEAPKALVKELGIEDKISRYSYQHEDKYYLEEDMDLYLFMQALDIQPNSQMNTDFWTNCPQLPWRQDAPLRQYARAKVN